MADNREKKKKNEILPQHSAFSLPVGIGVLLFPFKVDNVINALRILLILRFVLHNRLYVCVCVCGITPKT